jgi:hypothetical protein
VLSIGQAVQIPSIISSSENVCEVFSYVITKALGMAKRLFEILKINFSYVTKVFEDGYRGVEIGVAVTGLPPRCT